MDANRSSIHPLTGRHQSGGYRLGHLGKAHAFDRCVGQWGKVVGDQWTRYGHPHSAAIIVERRQDWCTAGSSRARVTKRNGGVSRMSAPKPSAARSTDSSLAAIATATS